MWLAIHLLVPQDINNPTVKTVDMLTKYGDITLDQVKAHAAKNVEYNDRKTQNYRNLY
jgi:hypothetical protein